MKSQLFNLFCIACFPLFSLSQSALSYSDTLMFIGTQSYKNLDLIDAKEKLDSCILLNPQNDECKYYRAKIEFDVKSYAKAAVMFKNVLALKELDASSWHMLGLCYSRLKHYDSAAFCFKNAVKINSKRSDFYANWAKNQLEMGDANHAEELYSTAILLNDTNALYYSNRAEVRKILGDMTRAAEDLEKVASLSTKKTNSDSQTGSAPGLSSTWLFGVMGLTILLFLTLLLKHTHLKK